MKTTYVQKPSTVQRTAAKAASLFDSSSQSKSLQRKANMANNAAQRAEAPRPNNTGMPDNLKSGIESLSGFSMDDVRVHYNSSKPATVQALAYTQGTDIHVAPGQEKHLPHEAWHVAQQMAGRVSPTTNINGMPVNDNAGLEHEADVMGEKAVQRTSDASPYSLNCMNISSNAVQCGKDKGEGTNTEKKAGDHYYNDIPSFLSDCISCDNHDIRNLFEKCGVGKYRSHFLNKISETIKGDIKNLTLLRDRFCGKNKKTKNVDDENSRDYSVAKKNVKVCIDSIFCNVCNFFGTFGTGYKGGEDSEGLTDREFYINEVERLSIGCRDLYDTMVSKSIDEECNTLYPDARGTIGQWNTLCVTIFNNFLSNIKTTLESCLKDASSLVGSESLE